MPGCRRRDSAVQEKPWNNRGGGLSYSQVFLWNLPLPHSDFVATLSQAGVQRAARDLACDRDGSDSLGMFPFDRASDDSAWYASRKPNAREAESYGCSRVSWNGGAAWTVGNCEREF